MTDQPTHPETSLCTALWQDAPRFLQTKIEYGTPVMKRRKADSREVEVVPVKIMVTNTAPADSNSASIVFTGISLTFVESKCGSFMNHHLNRWLRECHASLPQRRDIPIPRQAITGEPFPRTTSDEERHGAILFPGECVTYDLFIPVAAKGAGQFLVDASLSRRHLFHYQDTFEILA